MQLPGKRAGDEDTQRILQGREAANLSRGTARYIPAFGMKLVQYYLHDLENNNRVLERMKNNPSYINEMRAADTFRFFPSMYIKPEMQEWLKTYGPFAVLVEPALHEKGYREQRTTLVVPTVDQDHLRYLLALSDESSITAVPKPPEGTKTLLERATPHISLDPFVLVAAKPDYRHRFPTAVALAIKATDVKPTGEDYQQITPMRARTLLSRFPGEAVYRALENDARTGFGELLEALGNVKIDEITDSDREAIEMYSKVWNLPKLE